MLCSDPDAVQRRVCTRSGRVKALCNSRLKDVLMFSDIAPHRSQASVVALSLPSSKLHTSSHTPKRFTPTHSRLNCPSAPPIPTHDPRLPPRMTHHGDSTALQREQQDDVFQLEPPTTRQRELRLTGDAVRPRCSGYPRKSKTLFDNENLQLFNSLFFRLVNFVGSAQFELRKFMTRMSKCLQNIEGLQVLLT